MKAKERFYVRIDRKAREGKLDPETYEAHIRYIRQLASETELYAGCYTNHPAGMVIFKARDLEEAHTRCRVDPVVKKGFYTYDLYEWDVLISSAEAAG